MNGTEINHHSIIQDIATNKEQILDYRSKRKQLNIDPNDTRVAFNTP